MHALVSIVEASLMSYGCYLLFLSAMQPAVHATEFDSIDHTERFFKVAPCCLAHYQPILRLGIRVDT